MRCSGHTGSLTGMQGHTADGKPVRIALLRPPQCCLPFLSGLLERWRGHTYPRFALYREHPAHFNGVDAGSSTAEAGAASRSRQVAPSKPRRLALWLRQAALLRYAIEDWGERLWRVRFVSPTDCSGNESVSVHTALPYCVMQLSVSWPVTGQL